jgi:acetate kinase
VFCYRVAGHIASLAAALGGLYGIVFTAGVGENAAPVRSAICRASGWLGLELDEAANREHNERIGTPHSRVAAYVIKTNENLMIARHARRWCERETRKDGKPCPKIAARRSRRGRAFFPLLI